MGKIILIRHGKAGFGESEYDQLSEMGEYQAQVTGQFLKQAGIHPTTLFSGSLKRQTRTAEIACEHAGFVPEIIIDSIFNEYDYQGIIDHFLPELLTDQPSLANEIEKAFSDNTTFESIFSQLLNRWISSKNQTGGIESFESYINRVMQGMNRIAEKQNNDDTAIVFTSGGLIAVSMHMILGLTPAKALTLGWLIYNCSITSFYVSDKKYRLETFNSVGHLEMDARDGVVTKI
jgi:broad specificity phosphatase PhoE